MVWPITGAESYVDETGKSMKAMGLAVAKDLRTREVRPKGGSPSPSGPKKGMQSVGSTKGFPRWKESSNSFLPLLPSAITTTWKLPLQALRRSPHDLRHGQKEPSRSGAAGWRGGLGASGSVC